MFLKVMMHSMSWPAYTLGSLNRTKARMFEDGGVVGIVAEGRVTRRAYDVVTFRAIIAIAFRHTMPYQLYS